MEAGRRLNRAASSPPSSASASSATTATCYSPRLLLRRWLQRPSPPPQRFGGGEGFAGCRVRFPGHSHKKKREASRGEEAAAAEKKEAGGSSPRDQDPGMKPEEVSFNQGLCIGLLFIMAKSAREFDKMTELRKQMEILLKDIKDEVRRKDIVPSYVESDHDLVYSVAEDCGTGTRKSRSKNVSIQNCRTAFHMTGTHCIVESNRQSKCGKSVQNNGYVKMGQMEAELEVELERLQLQVEEENSVVLPQHHLMEVTSEGTNLSERSSVSGVEDNEPGEEESSKYGPVCARELERRLHELLESQQEERMAELESALELAERKLREKEIEICWWRDTARLASQHKDGAIFR